MDGVKEEAERVGMTGEDARDRGRLISNTFAKITSWNCRYCRKIDHKIQ